MGTFLLRANKTRLAESRRVFLCAELTQMPCFIGEIPTSAVDDWTCEHLFGDCRLESVWSD